jgi:hypothetical protein
LTGSQECIADWFTDVPQDFPLLMQMDRFRKHSNTQDVLFLQKQRPRDSPNFWENEKRSFGNIN